MHRIAAFVLAPGPMRTEGEVVASKALKRAPHYFGPAVPQQYIVRRDGHFTVKAYMPNIILVETWREVDDAFSDSSLELREQLLKACFAKVEEEGGDISISEEYAIAAVDNYAPQELQEYLTEPVPLVSFLRSERLELDPGEIEATLKSQIKYCKDDLVLVDWQGACVFEPSGDVEEVVELLQIANLQLLQYRLLDRDLDLRMRRVDELLKREDYSALRRHKEVGKVFREVVSMRARSITDFDSIEREIKLIGEWYSARLYDVASRRFKLPDWNASLRRKLDSLEDVYNIVSERFSISKLHYLELLQIILFFVLQAGWFLLLFLETRYFLNH